MFMHRILTRMVVCIGLVMGSGAMAEEQTRFITVQGEAEVEVPPDFVKLTLLISAEGDKVETLKQDVDRRAREVLASLSKFDIEETDLSFSGVQVNRKFKSDRNENETFSGYTVRRSMDIKLRKPEDYEQLVGRLVGSGVDELQGVVSDVDDQYDIKRVALAAAAKDARLKAQAIADGLGVNLGQPLEVGENHLRPLSQFDQRGLEAGRVSDVMSMAQTRGVEDPMLFVPDNIRFAGTVWVRFELGGPKQ
jgi:uncharacterized protein YggE